MRQRGYTAPCSVITTSRRRTGASACARAPRGSSDGRHSAPSPSPSPPRSHVRRDVDVTSPPSRRASPRVPARARSRSRVGPRRVACRSCGHAHASLARPSLVTVRAPPRWVKARGAHRERALTRSRGLLNCLAVSVTIEGERVDQLLRIIVAAATGDYELRVPLVEEDDDEFLEVELGVNYLLEELALGKAKSDSQRQQLEARAEELAHQQSELVEALSTPVIAVWPGVLALPLVGRIDDERAARITAVLLERVAAERATHVILDLTGVGTIAGNTMPGLLRMVRAIGLLGASCLLTGISPAVAQQIVALGEVEGRAPVRALAQLSDALAHVLAQKGALRG
nr:STAS domain-containing protein [Nannocystis pusilla]